MLVPDGMTSMAVYHTVKKYSGYKQKFGQTHKKGEKHTSHTECTAPCLYSYIR